MNLFWENIIHQTKSRIRSIFKCKFGTKHEFVYMGNVAKVCEKCGLIKHIK